MRKNKNEKIIVAMSGGVDSSVAAALMVEEGYDVIGVTMQLLPRGGSGFGCCGSPEDMTIAKRSAEKMGIPHYVLDYSEEFNKKVIDYFVNAYVSGETPNPCIACNRYIKFDKLEKFARSLGAKHLVTGHYARVMREVRETIPSYRLFESVDPNKDQSYVLYNMDQKAMSAIHTPIGSFTKPQIRQLAKKFRLPSADKKESQEICFVSKDGTADFVKNRMCEKSGPRPSALSPGKIKNTSGKILGEHKGVAFYTIGQRKGLGLAVQERYYVVDLKVDTNTLIVGPEKESWVHGLLATDCNWIQGAPPKKEFRAEVKIRYKHTPAFATIRVHGDRSEVTFDAPQKAVTPGQSAVFYIQDKKYNAREVLGGGKIIESIR